jgi:hypothetical protein
MKSMANWGLSSIVIVRKKDPVNRFVMNIFVGSKSSRYEITDGLPQYNEWPPEGAAAVRASKK